MRRMTNLLIKTVIQKKGPNNGVRFNLEDTAPTSVKAVVCCHLTSDCCLQRDRLVVSAA